MYTQLFDSSSKQRKKQLYKMSIPEIRNVLNYIRERKDNKEWFLQYESAIRDVLEQTMSRSQSLVAGVELHIDIWREIYLSSNYAKWERIIKIGSDLAEDARNLVLVSDDLKATLNKPSAPPKLRQYFKKFLDLKDEIDSKTHLLRSLMDNYFSMLERLAYDLDVEIDQTLLSPIFHVADVLDQREIFARIHVSLAHIYAARTNYNEAAFNAEISYRIYEDLKDEGGMAYATYALSLANRMIRFPSGARQAHFKTIKHNVKSGAIPLENLYLQEAGIQFELDRFDASIISYKKCIKLLDQRALHQHQHRLIYTKCLQGIALCQVWLGDFEGALTNLNIAYDLCIELNAKALLTNNIYIRGFLEGRRKNVTKAEMYLQRALKKANKLTDPSVRVDLQNSIIDTLQKLMITGGGDKLHNLNPR